MPIFYFAKRTGGASSPLDSRLPAQSVEFPAESQAGELGLIIVSLGGVEENGIPLTIDSKARKAHGRTSVVAAYCLFWFSVAAAVNAFGRSSATNAMILAGIWLVLVVIVPASVNLFVTGAYPVPSRVELVQAIREATNDANQRAASVMARYFLDHPEMVPQGEAPDPNDYQARSYAIREDVERAMAPVLARYDEQLLAQQMQVDRLKYLSPSIVAQEALNDIAGTGLARYKHFLGLVDRFHQEWRDYFVPKVFARRSLSASDYEAFPAFQYEEESGAAVRSRVSTGFAGLVVPLILVFAAGMGGLRRYPVTG
jgi:ABC-2 type transport system permease protein